jgi:hypothetical protein
VFASRHTLLIRSPKGGHPRYWHPDAFEKRLKTQPDRLGKRQKNKRSKHAMKMSEVVMYYSQTDDDRTLRNKDSLLYGGGKIKNKTSESLRDLRIPETKIQM